MLVPYKRAALLIIRPAPASRTSASAICPVTSAARTPNACRPGSVDERPPAFKTSTGSTVDARSAGSSDTNIAVTAPTPTVNHTVTASTPIIDAPIRVRPAAPAVRGVPGATADAKNTSGSGNSTAAA
jgi:hypothetical protein